MGFVVTSFAQNDNVKGTLLYKLSELVEWKSDGPTKIGVYKNDQIFNVLNTIASFGGSNINIKVVKLTNKSEATSCNMVFVGKNSDLSSELGDFAKGKTLFVTDDQSTANGDINLVSKEGRLAYEVNKTLITSRGLSASKNLYALAAKVK